MMETFFSCAHLTVHFGVLALKFAICFDCIHHSRRDLRFLNIYLALSPGRTEVKYQAQNTPQELVQIHFLAQGHFSWMEAC